MTTDEERITPANVGDTFTTNGNDYTVAESCGGSGVWHCLTHGETFQNQLQKDFHIHRGAHVLLWICFEHGPEVP